METYRFTVNGRPTEVTVDPGTPLLWVLRENLKMTQNFEPRPSVLSTPMLPFIDSASPLQIANPSPVPPNFREVELSA